MRLGSLLLVLFLAAPASGESQRTIDHARILLKDIAPAAPEGLADLDLGPAPPPGGSRVLSRADIQTELRRSGADPSRLAIPERTRIVSAARRIQPNELSELVKPSIATALPAGVTLTRAAAGFEIVVPPRAAPGRAKLPRPPRQKGLFRTTATVEFLCDGEAVAQVPVSVVLEIGDAAAAVDLRRGARVNLVIDRGNVRIVTLATMLTDGNIDERATALVAATSKVVRVKIKSSAEVELLEAL